MVLTSCPGLRLNQVVIIYLGFFLIYTVAKEVGGRDSRLWRFLFVQVCGTSILPKAFAWKQSLLDLTCEPSKIVRYERVPVLRTGGDLEGNSGTRFVPAHMVGSKLRSTANKSTEVIHNW